MKYRRILLKLSGESFMGDDSYGINYEAVRHFAEEIRSAVEMGVEVGVVIGGGNIFRGVKGAGKGFDRRQGDYMGMMATIINAMALETVLKEIGVNARTMTAMAIEGIGEKIYYKQAECYLKEGWVVIFGGGTGNPFFTTDSGAALRAVEINADLLLKGTRVDGVYTDDPEKNAEATKFNHLSYTEAYERNLRIMDLTAFTLCKENGMKLCIYNANVKGNLKKILLEEQIGTLLD
ncbi:UMP kinase [Bacteroidales bacterium OttesenSCG-928-B11]|nr:UMP kinase [Bacteroidales bacterium OttesenSCG-928-E04]MDL2308491.1 UMP kinase [Bacteroidales bacterium OttesenSCG-928-C03]MDL2311424.1 UMP kinase [Bacteroidales bacterium OttesenSCG-928-B11]